MKPLDEFRRDSARIEALLAIADYLEAKAAGIFDTTDVRRGALAMLVSALDRFVHQRIHDELVEMFVTGQQLTASAQAFPIPLELARSTAHPVQGASWLSQAVVSRHKRATFQRSSDISSAVSLVRSAKSLWSELATHSPWGEAELRERLDLIVDRRNRIVHESDCNPADPNMLYPLTTTDVEEALTTVGAVANGIDSFLS